MYNLNENNLLKYSITTTVEQKSQQDINKLFTQQKDCFAQQPWSDYAQRIKIITRIRDIILDNQNDICRAVSVDFGNRPWHETNVLEIFPILEHIKFTLKNLKSWMKPRKHKASKWFWPSSCWLQAQPLGVVGIIAPWNYPVFLSIIPMIAALAAGNRVMLKLSEYTPQTSELLQSLFANEFSESKLTVITGGAEIASQFSQLPFDHLFFTGSTETGRKVALAASQNLTPVTLELGGKSPVVLVVGEMDRKYIDRIWLAKLINAGQTCIAPDYIWLPRGQQDHLYKISRQVLEQRFSGLESDDYTGIINKANYDRIIGLIDEAVSKGAIWRPFTDNITQWHSNKNNIYKISPGLLLNTNHSMAIMQQEIFGPVLPVMEYDTFEELLSIMQVVPRPLAVYLFSCDKEKQQLFTQKTISGSLSFNAALVHAAQETLPFGGVGPSGMGCYRGQYGFDTFSMLKPIYKQSKLEIFSRFYPPKRRWQKALLKFMLKK